MFCREVKHRLNNKLELTEEQIKHIKNCAKCSREVQLSRMLDSVFVSAGEETNTSSVSFEQLKANVIEESASSNIKEMSLMAKIKHEIKEHPRFSFGLTATAMLIAILLLVPVSYKDVVGYSVAFDNVRTASMIPHAQLSGLVNSLGYNDAEIEVEESDNGYDLYVTNIPSESGSREIGIALSLATGHAAGFKITPKIELVSGNLYAQVKNSLEIKIDTKNKSDEEIQKEISKKLQEMGYAKNTISVSTADNGERTIVINMTDSLNAEDSERIQKEDLILELKDDGEINLSTLKNHPDAITVDTEGKSEEEIKKEIMKQLKAKGMQDAKVKVFKNSDGKVDIKIDVEKEEKK